MADGKKPFKKWLKRNEHTVGEEAEALPAAMRTQLILSRLSQSEFNLLTDHVAPTDPATMTPQEIIEKIKTFVKR